MKSLLRSFAVLFFLFVLGQPTLSEAQSMAGGMLKANLDLPFDAGLLVITFYSQQYEGDGIFYCIDHSSSMNDGELIVAKREVIRNIMEFSPRVQFGIVFFDRNMIKHPGSGRPTEANAAAKATAIAWVTAVPNGGGSCPAERSASVLGSLRAS